MLPKFEVKVELPPYLLEKEKALRGKVTVRCVKISLRGKCIITINCKVGDVQIADVDVYYFLSYFLTQQGTLMAKVLKDGQIFSCTLILIVEERGLH